MAYKHIFDYFDQDGKPAGGCEPKRETTDKPKNVSHGLYTCPRYVMYIGWCEENEGVYSGYYFPDAVHYNPETKQLTCIKETIDTPIGPIQENKISEHFSSEMTLEMACKIKGLPLPESYVKYKKRKEEEFQEEYKKVVGDKEYFKKNYYEILKNK